MARAGKPAGIAQMKTLLANLSLTQRITILAVALAAVVGIYALIHYQKESDFKPLFTGVAPEDAAAIVQKLRESGIEYRLPEGGGSVLVPSAHLAELRLTMAAAGLPKTGRIGFELFDKTNLGATEFTEHINYRRALEGELERSVMSLAEVEQARVHLTFPKDSVFLDAQQPAKASVLVKVRPHAQLAAGECRGDQQSGGKRRGGPRAGRGFGAGHERQSVEPTQGGRAPTAVGRPMGRSITAGRSRPICWERSTPRSNRCWAPTSSARGFRWIAILRAAN